MALFADHDFESQNKLLIHAIAHTLESSEALDIASTIVGFLRQQIRPRGTELESGLSKVIFVQFTCDNLYILTGSSSGSLKIWDFEQSVLSNKVRGVPELIVSLSHNGEWVSYNNTNTTLSILEIATCTEVMLLKGHEKKILCSTFSRSNEIVITGGYEKSIKLWELESGECLDTLEGHTGYITVLRCTENDRRLISASDDRSIKIWEFHSGQCLYTCGTHVGWISSFVITNDQRYVITGSIYVKDLTIKVFDIETGKSVCNLDEHGDSTKLLLCKGNTLVSAGEKNMIYVWDLEKQKLVNMLEIGTPKYKVTSFCLINKTLGCVGGTYGKLDFWNLSKAGKRLQKYKLTGGKDQISALDISHSGVLVACTNGTSNCRLWDLNNANLN